MQGIYRIRNKTNGKYYVGSSIDIEGRWREHKRDLDAGKHHDIYLQRAWCKYGEEKFAFEFVEKVLGGRKACLAREQEYLDGGFEQGILYNLAPNARGGGNKPSQETRAKMSKAHKGREITWGDKISKAKMGHEVTKESRQAQSKSMKEWHRTHENPFKGRKHTEEAKAKLRKAHKGKKLSEEHCAKISRAISGEGNPFYGKHHTEETKARLSKASKGNESGAKPYPAFYNIKTGGFIPAGYNLAKMCRGRRLNYARFYCLLSGITKQMNDGWTFAING